MPREFILEADARYVRGLDEQIVIRYGPRHHLRQISFYLEIMEDGGQELVATLLIHRPRSLGGPPYRGRTYYMIDAMYDVPVEYGSREEAVIAIQRLCKRRTIERIYTTDAEDYEEQWLLYTAVETTWGLEKK